MPLLKKSRCEHDQIIGFCLDCEKAHADALAEASRGFLVSALRFYSASPTPSYDERFEGALGALREVLAAHDKRRGRG